MHRVDRVQSEQKRRDHTKVTAAATHRPEQISVFFGTGSDEPSIRQNHIHGEQLVNGEATGTGQVADAAHPG
jgi:hypothetical protein